MRDDLLREDFEMDEAADEVFVDSPDGKKINCRSCHACADIADIIHKTACVAIDDCEDIEIKDKDGYKKRFKEIFETAMQENVSINGSTWEEALMEKDRTSEYEPIDMKKKKYITVDMMQSLDNTVVKTAHNRKSISQRYRCKLKQQSASESEYHGRIKVQLKENPSDHLDEGGLMMKEKVFGRLKESASQLSNLSKSASRQLQRLKDLDTALSMHRSSKNSKTDFVVYNPMPDEAIMAESITELKRKLEQESYEQESYKQESYKPPEKKSC